MNPHNGDDDSDVSEYPQFHLLSPGNDITSHIYHISRDNIPGYG